MDIFIYEFSVFDKTRIHLTRKWFAFCGNTLFDAYIGHCLTRDGGYSRTLDNISSQFNSRREVIQFIKKHYKGAKIFE